MASVCSPLDLAAGGAAIGRGFNRLVYTTMFLRSMKPKALAKLAQHPGLFDRDALMAARDLYEFDNIFTAPLHGFRNTDDYWARASAKPHLHRIRIPALVLNALNDPFVPAASLPRAERWALVTLWQPRRRPCRLPRGRSARARAHHARGGGRLAAGRQRAGGRRPRISQIRLRASGLMALLTTAIARAPATRAARALRARRGCAPTAGPAWRAPG